MTQWASLCTMNLIRRAYAMSLIARNRSDVVARRRIFKNRQRSACCFVDLGHKGIKALYLGHVIFHSDWTISVVGYYGLMLKTWGPFLFIRARVAHVLSI